MKITGLDERALLVGLAGRRAVFFFCIVELMAAAYLFADPHNPQSIALAIYLFSFLGLIGIALAVLGEARCGCWGQQPIPPWATAALDGVALAGLVAIPPQRVRRSIVNTLCDRLTVGVVIFVLGAAAFLVVLDRTWQGRTLAAFLAGRPISYQAPSIVRIPEGQSWELAKVYVRNRSEQPVTVAGYQQACGAAAKDVFPLDLAPGASAGIDVAFARQAGGHLFARSMVFFLSNKKQSELVVPFIVLQ